MAYSVFISFKNLDKNGNPTPDSRVAAELYRRLRARGVEVFFSNEEVQRRKRSDYGDLIDEALESSRVLLLVGSSIEYIESKWIKYEWDGFKNEINSGRKDGVIIPVVDENMDIGGLPFGLRRCQIYTFGQLDKAADMAAGQPGIGKAATASSQRRTDFSKEFAADLNDIDFRSVNGGYEIAKFRKKDKSGTIFLPREYQGKPVVSIGKEAFMGCTGLADITIPDSVNRIGVWAFMGCTSLKSIFIPNSVTSIDERAFYYCESLTSVTIPASVKNYGREIFYECNALTSVIFSNGATIIGDYAFKDCRRLKSVTIPNSVTVIGNGAFWGCYSLKSITIPNGVTHIGHSTFFGCSGLTVTIPGSVTSIGESAFWQCTVIAPRRPEYYGYELDRYNYNINTKWIVR